MTAWLLRRLLAALAIVFAVVSLSFGAIHLAPGTPFLPSEDRPVDPAAVARLRARFGLDRPLPEQYARYLGALVRGDLGESFSQRRPVAAAIVSALPNTLTLSATALAIDFLLGVAIGIVQAARARRRLDTALTHTTLLLYSVPTFWLGLVLLLVFGQWLRWFPVGGVTDPVLYESLPLAGKLLDRLHHLALPALTLGTFFSGLVARIIRSSLLEVLEQDFIKAARAKGVRQAALVYRHALSNALIPVVTVIGLQFGALLGGAVLTETVFAIPGMGRL
ncbi:MAG: ABC transporter permease, partial [Gemmatimonadales bacterium]